MHPGVYQLHTGELDWCGRASAALLRLGPGSAPATSSAAHLLGIEDAAPAMLSVLVPHHRPRLRVPGTRVARRRGLVATERRGLRVTTAGETVLDLGAAFGASRHGAVAVAARAVQRRRTTVPDLTAALAGRRAHQHRRALALALGVVASGAESGLEVDFHQDVLMAHGLPAMAMAVPDESGSLRRDFECEADHLVVEIDGRIGHGGAEARPRQPTRPQGRTHRPGAGA